MTTSGSWVGVQVKNSDGRCGTISSEEFTILDRILYISLDEPNDAEIRPEVILSANGTDSGEKGWHWLDKGRPGQPSTARWYVLGDHNTTPLKNMNLENINTAPSSLDVVLDNNYHKQVLDLIKLIDCKKTVSDDLISKAELAGLTVHQTASSVFAKDQIKISIEKHLSGENNFLDIDIEGLGSIRRVVLCLNIKEGDLFNVYYSESSKCGGLWSGDLLKTLDKVAKNIEKEDVPHQEKNDVQKPIRPHG